jgi:hypothetical protein
MRCSDRGVPHLKGDRHGQRAVYLDDDSFPPECFETGDTHFERVCSGLQQQEAEIARTVAVDVLDRASSDVREFNGGSGDRGSSRVRYGSGDGARNLLSEGDRNSQQNRKRDSQ